VYDIVGHIFSEPDLGLS